MMRIATLLNCTEFAPSLAPFVAS